jgi:hypothetical protein
MDRLIGKDDAVVGALPDRLAAKSLAEWTAAVR